jgi:hypothetical protein
MPHGNKKARAKATAKAKAKGSGRLVPISAQASGPRLLSTDSNRVQTAEGEGSGHAKVAESPARDGEMNQFISTQSAQEGDDSKISSVAHDTEDTLYDRYKICTQRFEDALRSMVPPEIFDSGTVDAFMEAAEFVAENQLNVEWLLLSDLKFSIRARQRVAAFKYKGGDETHAYFIQVLQYCWSVLAPRRQQQTRKTLPATDSMRCADGNISPNRFAGFATADDSEEEGDMEDDLPSGPTPRPEAKTRMSIDDLVKGLHPIETILFLDALDQLMQIVSV